MLSLSKIFIKRTQKIANLVRFVTQTLNMFKKPVFCLFLKDFNLAVGWLVSVLLDSGYNTCRRGRSIMSTKFKGSPRLIERNFNLSKIPALQDSLHSPWLYEMTFQELLPQHQRSALSPCNALRAFGKHFSWIHLTVFLCAMNVDFCNKHTETKLNTRNARTYILWM